MTRKENHMPATGSPRRGSKSESSEKSSLPGQPDGSVRITVEGGVLAFTGVGWVFFKERANGALVRQPKVPEYLQRRFGL